MEVYFIFLNLKSHENRFTIESNTRVILFKTNSKISVMIKSNILQVQTVCVVKSVRTGLALRRSFFQNAKFPPVYCAENWKKFPKKKFELIQSPAMRPVRLPGNEFSSFGLPGNNFLRLREEPREAFKRLCHIAKRIVRKIELEGELRFSFYATLASPGISVLREKVTDVGTNIKVQLHPALLVQKKNLPKELQVRGPEDPKFDSMYVHSFGSWLMREFNIPANKIRHEPGRTVTTAYMLNTDSMATFCAFLQKNPAKYESVLNFILTREFLYLKKQQKDPLRVFWYRIFNANVDERSISGLLSSSFSCFAVFSILSFQLVILLPEFIKNCFGILLGSNFFVGAVLLLCVLNTIQILHDLSVIYRQIQRERSVCKKAIDITKNPEAAKIFYEALNYSKWEDSFFLVRWVFRPLEKLFGELSDSHIDQLRKKSINVISSSA